jgi:hypothetical protein
VLLHDDGPFYEINEAFARGVLEGEARATRDQPPAAKEPPRRQGSWAPVAAVAAAAVVVVCMVTGAHADPTPIVQRIVVKPPAVAPAVCPEPAETRQNT